MPADHLEVAAAICYDGTPDYRERAWAEEHGWYCREFAITWDSPRPHRSRRALHADDDRPRQRPPASMYWLRHLSQNAHHPRSHAAALDRVHRRYHAGSLSLGRPARHGDGAQGPGRFAARPRSPRVGAVRSGLSASTRLAGPPPRSRRRPLSEFAQTAPDQRLTLQARRILAIYDADSAELFAGIEELLKRFPDDPLMTLSKISALRVGSATNVWRFCKRWSA